MKTDIFSPVLRFAVCSDLHIREENDVQVQRLRQLMQRAYRLAQESETYRALDAFLFAGDLTDGGTPAQYRAFWDAVQSEKQNGTRVIACVARAHDNWEQGRVAVKTGLRHCREITGLSTDTKPEENLVTGSVFIEVDTWDVYLYDEEAAAGNRWHKKGA